MKKYRRKPSPTFEAVQYTEETRDEIVMLLNADTHNVPAIALTLQPGDWLIRDHDGSYRRASDDIFRATYEEMPPELWCIHVQGPDTIIAQPDQRTAEARALVWGEWFDKRLKAEPPNPHAPIVKLLALPWPRSAEAHAADLAKHGGDPEDIC